MEDELLEEELQIAQEQDSSGKTLSSATFQEPISCLGMPSVLTYGEDATIKEVVTLMQKERIGSVLIVDKDMKLKGIITERDILIKVIGVLSDWESRPITEIMTPNPEALMATDIIAFALNNMHVGGYRHIPIVDTENRPVSIVSIKDVVSFILDYFPEEITNITSQPHRGAKSREGA